MRRNAIPFSIYGVPAIGLLGMMVCLCHPQTNLRAEAAGSEAVSLAAPDARFNRVMTIFLRQEAKNVAASRGRRSLKAQAGTVADYNLIAQECAPEVFQETLLPRSQ